MSKIDAQKLIAFLNAKWGGRACTMCSIVTWSVQDSTFELREFNQGNMVLGGPLIPVVPVICSNCGNTVLVNAIMAGLVAAEPPKPSGAQK
jgi:hypothetical protein